MRGDALLFCGCNLLWEESNKLPAGRYSGIWPRALPRCQRCRGSRSAKLSDEAGAHHRSQRRRQRARYGRAAGGIMVIGAARPAIRCRNRSGGGSNIGTEAAVRAPWDGYTLLLVSTANAINATLFDKLNFVFLRDIAPVAGILASPT